MLRSMLLSALSGISRLFSIKTIEKYVFLFIFLKACGKYMPATASTVQSNQIGTSTLQDGTYLVEESF